MKLLLITTDITIVGGIERVISNLTNEFIKRYNYEIEIVSLYRNKKNNHNTSFEFNKNIKISYCDIERKCKQSKNKIHTLILLIENYYRLIKDIKKVINERNSDIVMTFHTPISIACIFNKKNIHGKLIVTEHSEYNNCPDKIAKILRRILFKKSDKVVVLNKSSKSIYEKFCNNVIAIPNPVSFKSNKVSKLNNKRIISAGRLEIEKGFDRLIEAFNIIYKKNPGWTLEIFGDGSQRKDLENIIERYELKSIVNIHPFTNNLKQEMLISDIYAMPSRSECFSLVLLEAMECGLPCISFDTSGPKDIISNNKDGIIINLNDIDEFAIGLEYLIQNYNIRVEYGKNAKYKAKLFYIENIIDNWNNIIQDITNI